MNSFFSRVQFAFRLFRAFLLVVLRTEVLRRKLMMLVTIFALLMLFFGHAVIDGFLSRHPFVFAIYWIFCMSLVALMLLLGIYDLIRARRGQTNLLDDLKSIVPEDKLREIAELLEEQQQQGKQDGSSADAASSATSVPGERRVKGKVRDVTPDDKNG